MRDPARNRAALCRCVAGLLLVAAAPAAWAHHILGIPHYNYDERYPQAPVLTYLVDAGAHTVQMTGYPGKPAPHQRCELHVYIRRTDTEQPFNGAVTLTVMRDRMIADDLAIYGPIEASLDEALYKFYPEFEEESNYYARIEFEAEGAPWIIDLPIVVGEPGSPWTVVAAIIGGVIVFLVVIRAVRIKMNRRAAEAQAVGETAA